MNRLTAKVFFTALIALGLTLFMPGIIHAATFTVDSTGDGADSALDGLCAASGGACTLRAAIAEANNTAGPHTINFNIPTSDSGYRDFDTESTSSSGDSTGGDDFWTIIPGSVLPTITATGVTINGATQTTNQGDRNTSGPEIQIDGTTAGEVDGLTFSGTNGTVNSITINRFGSVANAIKVNADGFTLTNSYVGPFAKGNTGATTTDRSGYGIYFNVASGTVGTSTSNGNVISGNGVYGIYATCGTGSGKRVDIAGNKISLGADGSTALQNGTGAIDFENYCLSIVGGDTAAKRNYINGAGYGIAMNLGSSSVPLIEIYNNFFGTNVAGASNTSIGAYAIYMKNMGGAIYDADFVTVKIGALGKGNLFGYAYQTIAFWDSTREAEVAYNTFGSSYADTILFINYTANLNLTKIHHNYIGTSASDPYFGVATGANTTGGAFTDININLASNIEVYNNTIVGGNKGIGVANGSGPNVHDNDISGITGTITNTVGGAPGAIFSNNKVHDNAGWGLQTTGENGLTVSNNEFYNNRGSNVRIGASGNTGIKIRSNKMYNIGLRGADTDANNISIVGKLLPGTYQSSANDAGDPDAGNNELMNFPEIQTVTYIGGGKYRVAGRFDGKVAEAPFTIEVCESDSSIYNSGYGGCLNSLGTVATAATPDLISGSSNYFNYTLDVQSQYVAEHQGIKFATLATNNLNSTGTFSLAFDASSSNVNYTSHIDAVPVSNGDGTYTITVDSTGDQDNVSTQGDNTGAGAYSGGGVNGTSGLADGKTTLREAIIVANNFGHPTKIAFNIPTSDTGYRDYDSPNTASSGDSLTGDDYWKIVPATLLPTISNASTTIDGATQTTNQGNKNTSGPEIEINYNGFNTGTNSGGLSFTGANDALNGIAISNLWTGFAGGIVYVNGNSFIATNNYIGCDVKCSETLPSQIDLRGFEIGPAVAVSNVQIGQAGNGNTIKHIGDHAVRIETTAGIVSNTTIAYNTFSDMGLTGVSDGGSDTIVDHNSFSVCATASSAFPCVKYAQSRGNGSITNNTISNSPVGKGIEVTTVNSATVTIQGNNITGTTTGIVFNSTAAKVKATGNLIYGNTTLDIDNLTTSGSIEANDAGDTDSGINNLMNYPEITSVQYLGAHMYRLTGRIDAKVSEAPFTIEVCKSDNHASLHGGCTESLGTATTGSTADSTSGSSNYFNWSKDVTVSGSNGVSTVYFTTLATSSLNTTSEFGLNFKADNTNVNYSVVTNFPITLVAPAADASIDDVTPLFDWNASQLSDSTANPELDHYSLLIDGVELTTTASGVTQYQVTDPQRLAYGAHTWQVLAKKSDNSTNGTSIEQSFTITAPTYTFSPVYPVDVEIDTQTPLFDWTSIADGSDATFYELYLDGHFLTDTVPLSQSEYQLPDNLALAEGSHTWQVVAYYTDVNSQPVEVGRTSSASFTIKLPITNYPIELVNPKKGAETQDATPFFDWNTSEKDGVVNPSLSYYRIFINGSEVGRIDANDTEFTLPESKRLAYDKSYTWQVIGYSSADVSTGTSEERTFKVINPKYDFDPRYPVDVTIDTGHPIFRWTNTKESSVTDFDLFIDSKYVSTVKRNDDPMVEYELPVDKALTDGNHTWQVVAYYLDVNGKNVEVGRTKTSKFIVNTKIISQLPDTGTKELTKPQTTPTKKSLPELIQEALTNPTVLGGTIALSIVIGGGILILGNYLGWWFIPFLLVKRRKKKEKTIQK
jgi:hypothetical protein